MGPVGTPGPLVGMASPDSPVMGVNRWVAVSNRPLISPWIRKVHVPMPTVIATLLMRAGHEVVPPAAGGPVRARSHDPIGVNVVAPHQGFEHPLDVIVVKVAAGLP
ncbi:hypothetical protein CCO04_27195 [Pimelobacter sp. 30-1]|nr:hypothetical protein [Pimelobacter sp. 30-1]